ncbi:embryonic development factor [Sarcoptes scabiei]|nr:embryonic development factor [Sarcoptes scabiei]
MFYDDKLEYRKKYFQEWAILLDEDLKSRLLSLARRLNSILFALEIDVASLDLETSSTTKFYNPDEIDRQSISTSKHEDDFGKSVQKNVKTLTVSEKKRSNFIVIDSDDNCIYNNNGNKIEENEDDDISGIKTIARSAPAISMIDNIENFPNSESIDSNLSDVQRCSSSFSVDNSSNLCLFPITNDQNGSTHSISRSTEEIYNEKIEQLEKTNEYLEQQNQMLKIQNECYRSKLELIEFDKKTIIDDNEQIENNFQQKLVQISEMHGEIVEFNEHLFRIIHIKNSIINRLRDELIDLRGPLPDKEEISLVNTNTNDTSHSLQSLPQPLIHVWIPTAFLSGGFKGKSHHIYQIYVRIKEEEWNVYRRYSQLYSFRKQLKTQFPSTLRFEFPPKKAIGNKDSKVVQERRKKLETYLRNVINFLQTQNSDINSKERLTMIVPFLSEKYFSQNQNSHPSTQDLFQRSNQENTSQQQSASSRNYLGF